VQLPQQILPNLATRQMLHPLQPALVKASSVTVARSAGNLRSQLFLGVGAACSTSALVAWPSIQFVVGASRRRAAPRSQFFGAALVAAQHHIG